MNKDIVITKKNLPTNVVDLQKFILIGKEQLKAYQSKLKIIDKLELAKDVREQAIEDGQRMGTALLYAESRLGEILQKSCGSTSGTTKVLPEGITKKQSHYAQQLADNQDLIEEVIVESKEFEDMPTKG